MEQYRKQFKRYTLILPSQLPLLSRVQALVMHWSLELGMSSQSQCRTEWQKWNASFFALGTLYIERRNPKNPWYHALWRSWTEIDRGCHHVWWRNRTLLGWEPQAYNRHQIWLLASFQSVLMRWTQKSSRGVCPTMFSFSEQLSVMLPKMEVLTLCCWYTIDVDTGSCSSEHSNLPNGP